MATPKIYTYNSKDVLILLGGMEMFGFGDDSKISVTRDGNLSEGDSGVDGDITISFLNTTKGNAEVTLKYGSEWDIALDNIAAHQLPITLTMVHKESNKVLNTVAWVEEQPDTVLGGKADDRTWNLGLQSADFSIAQNVESTITGYKFFTDYGV